MILLFPQLTDQLLFACEHWIELEEEFALFFGNVMGFYIFFFHFAVWGGKIVYFGPILHLVYRLASVLSAPPV